MEVGWRTSCPPRTSTGRGRNLRRPASPTPRDYSVNPGDCRCDGADIRAAEKVHVNQQRVELVQRDAPLVTVGERVDLVVRGKSCRPEAAEQPHHGEIDLTVAAVSRRIDEAGRARVVAHQVSTPKVAVQPGGR